MALGDPLPQRRVADRGPVGGHPAGVGGEGAVGGGAQAFDIDDVERWGAAGEGDRLGDGGHGARGSYAAVPSNDTASSATSVGERPTRTPLISSASALAAAVPFDPDTIAPAWPIVFPGGAVKPAI